MTLRPDAPRSGATVVRRGFGALAMAVRRAALLIGALAGRSDPLQPLAGLGRGAAAPATDAHVEFIRVKTIADLDGRSRRSCGRCRPMLDFYADWCVSCKEMESSRSPTRGFRRRSRWRPAAGGRDRQR